MEKLRKVILIIAIIVFLGSAGYLGHYLWQGHKAESDFDSLKVEGGHDLAALYKKNSDIVGWLTIADTKVDYPVMQTPKDAEYYLRRNFQKEHSTAGTPFVDATSTMKGETKSLNWMIYGHNMKNGTMFHDILKYEDKDFYEKHKTFTFETINGISGGGTYEVVAAGYTQIYTENSNEFKYYQYASIQDAASFNTYIQGVKGLSEYDTGITPTASDQLITLSTCAYQAEEGRFIVVARKVR